MQAQDALGGGDSEHTLRSFLQFILPRHRDHGGVSEVRIIGKGTFKGIWSGYFTPEHVEQLIKALLPLRGGPRSKLPYGDYPRIGEANIYFGLHPVDPALLARSAGRIQRADITTADADIVVFDSVPIDVDPVRKAGISATDEEKAKANEVCENIRQWLEARGIVAIRADSGNGYHLIILTIPYEDVQKAAEDTRRFLALLKKQFETPEVEIDQTVYNPSRILKLYGTQAVKGDNLAERPHRFAFIDVSSPPENIDLFAVLADELASPSETAPEQSDSDGKPASPIISIPERKAPKQGWSHETSINVIAALLEHAGIAHRVKTKADRTVFEFETCPHHTDPDGQHFECCVIVEGSGRYSGKCQHDSKANWTTFKPLLQWGANISEVLTELGIVRHGSGRSGIPDTPQSLGVDIVRYVTNRDNVNSLFDSVLQIVQPTKRFYNLQGEMIFIRPGIGLPRVRETNLNAFLGSFLEVAVFKEESGKLDFKRFGLLPPGLRSAFAESPRLIGKLPVLKEYSRSPLFDHDWNLISRPGFHPESGIYYDGPAIHPTDGTEHLDATLSAFRWKSQADLTNVIGMLLTGITMSHWITGHPMLVLNGNRPGVGKTLVAKVLSVIIDGRQPRSVSYSTNDEEFEKQLATRVDSGDRVIMIDNAKKTRHVREVESQVLERSITDGVLHYRRLGGNTSISRPNDVLFVLTMNYTKLSKDLRRRQVPVNLHLDIDPRRVNYPIPDLLAYVTENRETIVAELLGIVDRWVKAGRPIVDRPAMHSVGQTWAAAIDSMLRHSGYTGFLENYDESERAFDSEYVMLAEICRRHRDAGLLAASEWARLLVNGVMEERLKDRRGNPKPERAQATLVGTFFSEQLGSEVDLHDEGVWVVVNDKPRGEGHTTLYGFSPLTEVSNS